MQEVPGLESYLTNPGSATGTSLKNVIDFILFSANMSCLDIY